MAINPGVFLGLGPCTLAGVFYPTCSTNGNLNQRRVFSLSNENPAAARLIGNLDIHDGARHAELSRAEAVVSTPRRRRREPQRQLHAVALLRRSGVPDRRLPADCQRLHRPAASRVRSRPCDQDRTHIAVFTAGAQVPRFDNRARARRALGLAGVGHLQRALGQPLNVIAGRTARSPASRISASIRSCRIRYGDKTLNNWLNPAAFAQPAPGHARQLQAQQRAGARLPDARRGLVASRVVRRGADSSSCAWRRSTC